MEGLLQGLTLQDNQDTAPSNQGQLLLNLLQGRDGRQPQQHSAMLGHPGPSTAPQPTPAAPPSLFGSDLWGGSSALGFPSQAPSAETTPQDSYYQPSQMATTPPPPGWQAPAPLWPPHMWGPGNALPPHPSTMLPQAPQQAADPLQDILRSLQLGQQQQQQPTHLPLPGFPPRPPPPGFHAPVHLAGLPPPTSHVLPPPGRVTPGYAPGAYLPPQAPAGGAQNALLELLASVQQRHQLQQQQQRPASEQALPHADPASPHAPSSPHGDGDRPTLTPRRAPGAPQPGREGRWVDFMDRKYNGRGPRADLDRLDADLVRLADNIMATPEERASQMRAFGLIRNALLARWPEGKVHLFGSVANGLSVRSSNDIDVCLELPTLGDEPGDKGAVAEEIGAVMETIGCAEILTLPKARVPVVKLVVPSTGTKADVTVNNILATVNTKLLADYCAIDRRLPQLVRGRRFFSLS
jgi:hypothetical protein